MNYFSLMFGRKKTTGLSENDVNTFEKLAELTEGYKFDTKKHDRETRKQITKLFLNWYF